MAWTVIQKPGTEHGPCAKPCKHTDCAASRRMAHTRCRVCEREIGYGEKFCEGDDHRLAHFSCVLMEYERTCDACGCRIVAHQYEDGSPRDCSCCGCTALVAP